jgi:hypothetical protein
MADICAMIRPWFTLAPKLFVAQCVGKRGLCQAACACACERERREGEKGRRRDLQVPRAPFALRGRGGLRERVSGRRAARDAGAGAGSRRATHQPIGGVTPLPLLMASATAAEAAAAEKRASDDISLFSLR